MGLKMTLVKEMNHMYTEFVDAYWCIEDVGYDTQSVVFTLYCYPSREVKLNHLHILENPSLGYGSAISNVINGRLYLWEGQFSIEDIFPQGIPLGKDEQLKVLYKFVKDYTQLPFKDVLED